MSKHTKGPWVVIGGAVYADGDGAPYPIAKMDRETPATRPVERDANAHLIAAAPDLAHVALALSLWAQGDIRDGNDLVAIVDAARAAIHKTEGAN